MRLTLRSARTYNFIPVKRSLIAVLLVVALLLPWSVFHAQQSQRQPPAPAPQGQPEPPQRLGEKAKVSVTVNLVDVLFTVLNRRNKLVTDLTKDDFRVFDDGQPQDIRFFSRQTDLPLRIGLLLDTSNSIRDRIQFEKDAATEFLFNVLRRGKDQSFLMIFDDQPSIIQEFTDDAGKLRDQIMRVRAGGGTAIYDAIYAACRDQLSHPPRPPGDQPDVVRRVMVVISDGDDTLSEHTRSEAIEMAQLTSVVIYTISTSTQWASATEEKDPSKRVDRKYQKTDGDKVLEELANETGGRAFFPYRVDDLDQSFLDIGDELRSQYSLAYNPTNHIVDGKYHKVRIETRQKGLQVRARRGYIARNAATTATKPAGN